MAIDIRAVFNASNANKAKRLLDFLIDKYEQSMSVLVKWAEDNIPDGLSELG
ncbi:hypothetical protein CRYPD_1413 [uncultured Candidatus Thioglobus sp.]|nr:hypothetical protein CRYPD_1413 [uncultured Candidatus Thioglobus sp.]